MGSQLLSQDEVEALLQGPHGAEHAFGSDALLGEGAGAGGTPLTQPERHWRVPLPALQRMHERFARGLREALPALLRHPPELLVGAIQVQRFNDFLREVTVPTNFNVISLQPLHGQGLIVCDPGLVFGVVDALFGGSGKFQTQLGARAFSATEQRVIQRLLDLVLDQFNQAWAELLPLQAQHERSETLPQFATITAPLEWVLSTTFALQVGQATGGLTVCLPCAMLEPLRAQLAAATNRPERVADPRWANLLQQEIQAAEVELVAELAQASATVQQLMCFKPGDFIELDMPPQVRAKVNGLPVLVGHHGICNNRYAIQVEHLIQHAGQPWLTEKQHAQ